MSIILHIFRFFCTYLAMLGVASKSEDLWRAYVFDYHIAIQVLFWGMVTVVLFVVGYYIVSATEDYNKKIFKKE